MFEEQGERTWEKMKRRDRHIFSIKWTFGIGYLSLRMIWNSSYCNCWTPAPFEMRVSLDIHTATFSCPLLPNSDYILSAVPWRLLFSDLFLNVVTFQSSTFYPSPFLSNISQQCVHTNDFNHWMIYKDKLNPSPHMFTVFVLHPSPNHSHKSETSKRL